MTEAERVSKEKERRQAMFYDRMAHLLVSPLNNILNGAEYIQTSLEKGSLEQQQEAILLSAQTIQSSAHWLDRLAQNLLDLMALFSGDFCPVRTQLEVCSQLNNLLELCLPYAQRQGVRLEWSRKEMPLQFFAMADPALADRVFLNLLSNAIRFSRPQGTVAISLEQKAGECRVSIQDEGPGIPREIRRELFDPYREFTPQSMRDGSGIGLYIANEFCKAMGWRLEIGSGEQGTEAVVFIPSGTGINNSTVRLASGQMAQEVRRREQSMRVEKEMTALFGELHGR